MMTAATELLLIKAAVAVPVGAAAGSFAATAALRMAEGRNTIAGRSRCDGCARQLGWAETVPFVGYAVAKGACRSCGARSVGVQLLGEGLGAAALTVPLLLMDGAPAVLSGLLCLLLLVSALIDVKTLRLPDVLTAAIAASALGLAVLSGHITSGLVACALSGAMLYGLKLWLEHRHARPMLGLGDAKLVAALGLWLNLRTPAMLAVAAIIGLVVILATNRRPPVPFGPMIAAASVIVGVCVPEGWLA